jgi:hypothetical protein
MRAGTRGAALVARSLVMLPAIALLALPGSSSAQAQQKVRTETIRPGAPTTTPPSANQFLQPAPDAGPVARSPARPAPASEVPPHGAASQQSAADLGPLPPAVQHTRDRILAAAHTGDLQTLLAQMRAGSSLPVFSHTQKQDPAAYWKETYPDSEGVEILSILISILETPPVRIEAGTPQETFVWPYFARLPVKSLTPAQKVDLFRVVTGSDYKEMLERGRYVFYQVGISPDGTWRYFLASE